MTKCTYPGGCTRDATKDGLCGPHRGAVARLAKGLPRSPTRARIHAVSTMAKTSAQIDKAMSAVTKREPMPATTHVLSAIAFQLGQMFRPPAPAVTDEPVELTASSDEPDSR